MLPLSRDFEMTERSGSLLNDIGEQRAEGTKLYEQMCRLDYTACSHRPAPPRASQRRARGAGQRSGIDSSAGVEVPSTLVQRRHAPRARPQD